MNYCPNCGTQITTSVNFCPNCGQAFNQTTAVSTSVLSSSIASSGSGDLRLILVDRGTCPEMHAENLLIDLLNYSVEDADQLVELAPVEIADNLSALQARTLAQAFTEYGCQVTVINENGETLDVSDKADSSVFDNKGELIAKAAAVIAGLTLVNKVTSYRRYKKPSLLKRIFKPRYRIVPPKLIRHHPMPHRPLFEPKPVHGFFQPKPAPRKIRHHVAPRKPTPSRHGGRRRGF